MVKKNKFRIFPMLTLVFILLGTAFCYYYSYIKKEKMELKKSLDYYNSIVQNEQEWLASLQQSNGALAFRGKENGMVSIVPYFSSITAIALLQKSPGLKYEDAVKNYFDWHFSHLNSKTADKNGLSGTIYNYSAEVSKGVVQWEKSENDYDSTDSYAALFLIALWEYYKQTGNTEYLNFHYKQIVNVIGAMDGTIDKDGLSYAKPDYKVKYLMDNAEVFKGVSCAVNLLKQVFLPVCNAGTPKYNEIKQRIAYLQEINKKERNAFQTILWSDPENHYKIGIDNAGHALYFDGWSKFYPDAVAQLSPINYDMLAPDNEQAHNIYNTFGKYFDWEDMSHYENGNTNFYWGSIAYCGALMHDEKRVHSYLDYYMTKVAPGHEYPIYNADSAWVVLASSEMSRFYQKQMNRIDPLGIIKIQ